MARMIAAALALALVPGLAGAQSWQGTTRDDGSYLHGTATLGGGAISMWCAAPSPQGIDPGLSDANLVEPMAPYAIRVIAQADQVPFPIGGAGEITVWAGSTGFRMGMSVGGEMSDLRVAEISMGDRMIGAVLPAQALAVDLPDGQRWTLPVDGLAGSLQAAMAYCASGWRGAGIAPPPAVQAVLPPGIAPAVQAATPQTDLARLVDAHIRQGCEGSYTTQSNYLISDNVDGDGIDDLLLDWNLVSCSGANPRPFCGAANCTGAVFLSALTPSKGSPEEVFGMSHGFVALSNGLMGVGSSFHAGSAGTIPTLFYWDGTAFSELNLEPVQ